MGFCLKNVSGCPKNLIPRTFNTVYSVQAHQVDTYIGICAQTMDAVIMNTPMQINGFSHSHCYHLQRIVSTTNTNTVIMTGIFKYKHTSLSITPLKVRNSRVVTLVTR